MHTVVCEKCGQQIKAKRLPVFHCGRRHGEARQSVIDTRGYDHAEICRTNRCGNYDNKNDTCKLIIRIHKEKGLDKSGKVAWLYSHPNTKCPNDPPMWSVDDGVDARTHQSQRLSHEVGSKEQVRKS